MTVRDAREPLVCSNVADTPFYGEAVVWKILRHANVVPFLGVTISTPLQLVTEWMHNGTLTESVNANHSADRVSLVRIQLFSPYE